LAQLKADDQNAKTNTTIYDLTEKNQAVIAKIRESVHNRSGYRMVTEVNRENKPFDVLPIFFGAQGTLGVITEVNAYKEGAKVFAPADAEIQTIIPNEGEIVNAGYPVMNLIDSSDEWVVFNIREDKMANFKIGTKFKGIVPALANQEIELEVKHIAVQADFATWTATKSKGDFDKKTFAIKAYPTQKVKDLRPGMSVLVEDKN